jgi:hypothetical protein
MSPRGGGARTATTTGAAPGTSSPVTARSRSRSADAEGLRESRCRQSQPRGGGSGCWGDSGASLVAAGVVSDSWPVPWWQQQQGVEAGVASVSSSASAAAAGVVQQPAGNT